MPIASLLIALYVSLGAGLIAYGRSQSPHGTYDAIIVAGFPARMDGRPSPTLAGRVEHAVAYFRSGLAPRLVMTGGAVRRPYAEAAVAARLAASLGARPDAIAVEDRSRTTEENAANSVAILGRAARVLVVTSDYHVFRTQRIFARYFASSDVVGCGHALGLEPLSSLHEVFKVARFAVLGRL